MRVALFITCFNDTVFPETGKAVVSVLERLGHEVVFPLEQTCCGQMHFNTGYQQECLPLVQRFVETFAAYDAIVAPSASCVGMVRDFHQRVVEVSQPRGADLGEAVHAVAAKTYEFSEFLVDVLGVSDVGAYFPHRVTYHPTCHSLRVLKLGDKPLQLLRAVGGIDLVELSRADECCGFGGTFALKNAEVSSAMLGDKLRHVLDTGAEICTAGDNSCLMQIGGALSRMQAGVRTMHLAEILAETEEQA